MENFCLVAVNFPSLNSKLIYKQNPQLGEFKKGQIISVPLGKRFEQGLIIETDLPVERLEKTKNIKEVNQIIGSEIEISEVDLELYSWAAKYYHYSLGKFIFDTIPDFSKKSKSPNAFQGKGKDFEFDLNETQTRIIHEIAEKGLTNYHRHLIHGVTGSGKTIIYLEIIKKVLEANLSVLFLLPEINLTPQLLEIFENYTSKEMFHYHSGIPLNKKLGLWKKLKEDDHAKIIIGTRSSIFLPIKNLGLIIVDEEHDQSFKQEDRCPYNARDLAIKKASIQNIPIILGSATPSLESYYFHCSSSREENNRSYHFIEKRVAEAEMPELQILSLKSKAKGNAENPEDKADWPFLRTTKLTIEETLTKGDQVLIFINRLGYANFIQCKSCGKSYECINCSVNLKYFKNKDKLVCQFCDYSIKLPDVCCHCGCLNLIQKGFGTEKILEVVKGMFPNKNIDRFDRDEIKNLKQLKLKLDRFHHQKIDILIGTQMLAKGHNFKKVKLVVILGIDFQLNFPDFRADEKALQLLEQVSGRSGRFGGKSKVIIQTMNPDHDVFFYMKSGDKKIYYESEMQLRETCFYPPYYKLAVIYIITRFFEKGTQYTSSMGLVLNELIGNHFKKVYSLGPRTTLIQKRVNQYSWCFMLKSEDVNQLHNLLRTLMANTKTPSGIQIKIDIDPSNCL